MLVQILISNYSLMMLIFFVEGDSEFELIDKVNKLLDKISLWCTANKLSLSPDKTCYSSFWKLFTYR